MQRIPFGRSLLDPRRANNFLDSCAFDPKYSPEDDAAQQIRALGKDGQVNLVLTHSNQEEIDHPNTPADVKREAAAMLYTIETSLNQDEVARKTRFMPSLPGMENLRNTLLMRRTYSRPASTLGISSLPTSVSLANAKSCGVCLRPQYLRRANGSRSFMKQQVPNPAVKRD